MPTIDPNRKFVGIAKEAHRIADCAREIAILYDEATKDGITTHRENRIKFRSKQVELGMRKLRVYVKTYKPQLISHCEHCGHEEWRDD